MKRILTFCILLVALCIASPAQSWKIYNRGTAANSELLDGLDSTAFTLQSTFSAYTSTAGNGDIDFSNITSAIGITFGATDNMDINASSHTAIDGVVDITLTPSTSSTRGTQVTIDANGQNDTMAHNVTYTANGMGAGDIGMAMEINVHPGTSTGGEVEGLRITRTGVGGVDVNAIHVGTRVAPIHQSSGTPENMDIAFLNNSGVFVNATTAFRNDSSTWNYTLVPNTNDYVYIGHTSIFSVVEIILETSADTSIVPVFEYYTGGWTVFGPNESTAGFTTDGTWSWDTLSNWIVTTVNGVANKYWIRAQRTATVTTDAVEKTINIITPTDYSWGEDGDLTNYDIMMQGTIGVGADLDVSGEGTRCFFYPKKAAWRCGYASSVNWDDFNIGIGSHAEGNGTKATGTASHAEGTGTSASYPASHAEGNSTSAAANASHAEGTGTVTTQTSAHAEGTSTLASAVSAHAEGVDTTASGTHGSHSEGNNTTASGQTSHAEGGWTVASGLYAHAENRNTEANGDDSHAGGYQAIANANKAFAHGSWLKIDANASNSVMFGSYNGSADRDANILNIPDTMKLANMNLIVDGDLKATKGVVFSGITTVTTAYTITASDYKVFSNAATINTISIDALSTFDLGQDVRIIKTDSTLFDVIVDPSGSETINGLTAYILAYPGQGVMITKESATNWRVLQSTSVATDHKSYGFSPAGTCAVPNYCYAAGEYDGDAADKNLTQASTTGTHGTANEASGARAYFVFGAYAAAGGSGSAWVTVSGTSITDAGVRTTSDSEIIVADLSAGVLNQYYQTDSKWIGLLTYTLVCSGACTQTTYSADFNTGAVKFEDFGTRGKMGYTVTDFEVTGLAGANSTVFNMELLKHSATGWIYHATAHVPGNGVIVSLTDDYVTETQLINGQPFAYDRAGIEEFIDTDAAIKEGLIIRITTGANNAIDFGNAHIGIRY